MKLLEPFLKESNAIEGVYDFQSFKDAIRAWKYLWDQPTLTPPVICKIHAILMENQKLLTRLKGNFRDCPVYIGNREAPPAILLQRLMEDWCVRANKIQTWREIKEDHIFFEYIHPFADGNGRIGRMLLNWQRLMIGLEILVIKENEKPEYYSWFDCLE